MDTVKPAVTQIILTVVASDARKEKKWVREIKTILDGTSISVIAASQEPDPGHIVFVDNGMKSRESYLKNLNRKGRAVFLVTDQKAPFPKAIDQGFADDVVVYPFRKLDVVGKVRSFHQILTWHELTELNHSFTEITEKLREDLSLAERLQKAGLPKRFPNIRGFQVSSRYLAGMKSGGDFFDLAESEESKVPLDRSFTVYQLWAL